MSDIFTIEYEEAVKNGIVVGMQKFVFDTIIKAIQIFCKEGCAFVYRETYIRPEIRDIIFWHSQEPYSEKEILFRINDFNSITDEQFYMLKDTFRNFGHKKLLFLINLRQYFNGESFVDDNVFELKEKIRELERCKYNITIENQKIKDRNKELTEENKLLKLEISKCEKNIKRIEVFKIQTQKLLDMI